MALYNKYSLCHNLNMHFLFHIKISKTISVCHLLQSGPFFKLLSMLVEFIGGPPGMPPFTQYILHKIWEVSSH